MRIYAETAAEVKSSKRWAMDSQQLARFVRYDRQTLDVESGQERRARNQVIQCLSRKGSATRKIDIGKLSGGDGRIVEDLVRNTE